MNVDQLLEDNKIINNYPINKTYTKTIPYNKKIIGNLKHSFNSHQQINNFKSKTENYIKDSNYDSNIDNKVINININYNDKFDYFYNTSDIKDNEKYLDINFLNYYIKEKKLKASKNNNILEIGLKRVNTEKKIDNHSVENKDINPIEVNSYKKYFSNKKDDIIQNSYSSRCLIKKNLTNCTKVITLKSDNDNNIIKRNYSYNFPKKEIKDDKRFDEIISDIIKDESIILLLKESNKWEDRKKGFIKLNEFIMNKLNIDLIKNNLEYFFLLVYYKLNYFKENNITLLIEGLNCILSIFKCIINNNPKIQINKLYMELIINNFNDKISDVKLGNIFFKLLYLFTMIYSTKDIFDLLLNNIYMIINIENSYILREYSIFIKNILEKNISKNKDIINNFNINNLLFFISKASNIDNNSEMKSLYVSIIYILYQIYGKKIKDILREINEPLHELVEKEIKLKIKNENNNNNNKNNEKTKFWKSKSFMVKNNIKNKKYNINMNNNFRKDISNEISQQLIIQLSSANLEDKKNAADYINDLIIKSNYNISINGLNNLFLVIKDNINGVDQNNCIILQLLSNLILSLGTQIEIYSNSLIYPLLLNLSNKSEQIRNISSNCIENLIIIQGFNSIGSYILELLNKNNINKKIEILKFLLNNYKLIEINNDENLIQNLSQSLLNCLLSNNLLIINYTENLIKKLFNIIRKESYIEEIKNINGNIKDKEYLNHKINILFSNINNKNKNSNNANLNNNRSINQNIFRNYRTELLRQVNNDSSNNNINLSSSNTNNIYFNNSSKTKIDYKQKILEQNNISDFSNSTNNNLSLKNFSNLRNISIKQFIKKRSQNRLKNNDKCFRPFFNRNTYIRRGSNKIEYTYDNSNSSKMIFNNSLTLNRKKSEMDKFNKLINSTILSTSKKKNMLILEEDSKSSKVLPNKIKQEIKLLKTMNNGSNKTMRKIKSDMKKKIPKTKLKIKLKQNYNSNNKDFDISRNINNNILFNENIENYIFISNRNIENINEIQKKDKQIRYEEDKKNNFDIHEMLDKKYLPELKNISKNIFLSDFIQNLLSEDKNKITFCLNQFKDLINNCILKKDENLINKIFNNLDVLLKILSIQLYKYKDDVLNKTFFIFIYSLTELAKSVNYFFNDTEITILLNILCNKLKSNKEIFSETAYNLIFFINTQCNTKLFIVIFSKLLKYQNYKVIEETIKVLQKLCEKCKYDKEIINEIIEHIVKIYIFTFYKHPYIKDKLILPLLSNIYDSIGNKFWDYCIFLSNDQKEILSKSLCEFKQNKNENYDDLYIINKKIGLSSRNNDIYKNISSNKKIKENNMNFKNIKKINYNKIIQIKENKEKKIIKRNRTTKNIKYNTYEESNNYNYIFPNIFKDKGQTYHYDNESLIESRLLKSISLLNLESSNSDIVIDSIFTIYNLVYMNYDKYKDIIFKNINNIIDTFIKKINNLLLNLKSGLNLIKNIFNILYKLCSLKNLRMKISFNIHQKLFFLLIMISTNKEIKIISEKTEYNEEKVNIENCKEILENVNSIIIYIIKYFDITNNILILINNLKNNIKKNIKLVEFSIKCLFYVIKNIKENYLSLRINIIFIEIQDLFDTMIKKENDLEKRNNNIEKSIFEIIKSLIIEIIIYRKEIVLEIAHTLKNKKFINLINNILKNMNKEENNNDYQKGYLFNRDTFYPRKSKNIKIITNEIHSEEKTITNFNNIKRKWTEINEYK